jgi:hypothetical protein
MQSSLNKADHCGCLHNGWKKKIKLQEEAISEILVADTLSESGAEASDDDYLEEVRAQNILQLKSRHNKYLPVKSCIQSVYKATKILLLDPRSHHPLLIQCSYYLFNHLAPELFLEFLHTCI